MYRNAVIALQEKTVVLVYTEIISQIIKFAVTFTLVFAGFGILAIVLGFFFHYLFKVILLARFIFKNTGFPKLNDVFNKQISQSSLLKEGMLIWVPTLVSSFGNNLGVLFVNVGNNLGSVGVYFIALMIYLILCKIPSQVQTALFPVFSGIEESINKLLEKSLVFSLVAIMPFTAMVMFYPEVFLKIFGNDFIIGSDIVFLLSTVVFIDTITTTIMMLQYSRGLFRNYALITIPFSSSKIVLYFILVPISGGLGAAQSWVIGSIIGFVLSLIFVYKIGIVMNWYKLLPIAIIPVLLGAIFSILTLHFSFAFVLIFIISMLSYIKLKILTRSDIEYILKTLMPKEKSMGLIQKITKLLDKLRL